MPMFFFETFDGAVRHRDEDGLDYPSDDDARREALRPLPDMAREVMPDGDFRIFRSIVRDERGGIVYEARMTLVGRWGHGRAGHAGA